MKKYAVVILVLVLGMAVLLTNSLVEKDTIRGKRIVNIVILLDFNNVNFDDFYSWLSPRPANYTFALLNWGGALNATQINWLQSQAELIPGFGYLQTRMPRVRASYVDSQLDAWNETFGSYPNGIFSFQPDTYTVNYTAQNYGVEYWQGYCFDQYVIDYMTERGGWQMPYYANPEQVLRPNSGVAGLIMYPSILRHSSGVGGVVIYPHLTWDWIASFTVAHQINTHPLWSAKQAQKTEVPSLVCDIIDRTLNGSRPYGYATFMFEYDWIRSNGCLEVPEQIIGNLTSWSNIQLLNLSDTTDLFKNTYITTPNYTVNYTSPYDNSTVEWYYSKDFRVARVGNYVKSFVDYKVQDPDVFLNTNTAVVFNGTWFSGNDIDDSLNFTIDALGGAKDRAPITTNGFYYPTSESLVNFPKYYYDNG
jgi:hypothetical protein